MPDISMCMNKECSNRKDCFRYMAEPSVYCQSYFAELNHKSKEECNHYWPVEEAYGKLRRLKNEE